MLFSFIIKVKFKPSGTIEEAFGDWRKLYRVKVFRKLTAYWMLCVIIQPIIQWVINNFDYQYVKVCFEWGYVDMILLGLGAVVASLIFAYTGFVLNSVIYCFLILGSWLITMVIAGEQTEYYQLLVLLGKCFIFLSKLFLNCNVILSCDILFRRCGVLAFTIMMIIEKLAFALTFMFPEKIVDLYMYFNKQKVNLFGYAICICAVGSVYMAILVQKGLVKRNF